MSEVLDLDILKPEKRIVKIAGKEIDASFVPVAITWQVDKLVRELVDLGTNVEKKDEEKYQKRALDLSCELCAAFSYKHAELDKDWWMENASPQQVEAFVGVIKTALEQAYAGVEAYRGNA